VISASVLLRYLPKNEKYLLCAVNHSPDIHKAITQKLGKLVSLNSITSDDTKIYIVDFSHHSVADYWIDHHISNKIREEAIRTKEKFFDSTYPSCIRLVRDYVKKFLCSPEDEIDLDQELMEWTDKIDGARYKSPEEIFQNDDNPYIRLNMYISENRYNDDSMCRIVELLANNDLDVIMVNHVLGDIRHLIAKKNEALIQAKKNITLLESKVAVLTQSFRDNYPRYVEFHSFRDIYYAIRITQNERTGFDKIHIGANIFKKPLPRNINIGLMMKDLCDGGGHKYVGSGHVKASKTEGLIDLMTDRLFQAITDMDAKPVRSKRGKRVFAETEKDRQIREGKKMAENTDREDDGIEKNAVSAEDPVEKKAAEEIEKTGSDVDTARENAVEEIEKK